MPVILRMALANDPGDTRAYGTNRPTCCSGVEFGRRELRDQVLATMFSETSQFSRDAEEYANAINSKIILIDGERLANLMVDHNVGVTAVGVYELKRIDSDYFEGE